MIAVMLAKDTFPVDNTFVTLSLYFRRTRRGGSESPDPIRDHGLGQSPVDDHGQDHDQDDEKLSKSFLQRFKSSDGYFVKGAHKIQS